MGKKVKDEYSLYNMDNIRKAKTDPDYLGEVIKANSNLIWRSIHKYIGKPEIIAKNNGIDKDDIYQLGCLGFIKAIKAFDPDRGIKFSSFAVTAIYREIRCYIRDSANIVRLTRSAFQLMNKIKKIEGKLGYIPATHELAKILGEDEEKISKVLMIGKQPKYLEEYHLQGQDYLDTHEINSCGTLIQDDISDLVHTKANICKVKDKLSPIELKILNHRLKEIPQTQIAKELGISQKKVSKVIKKIAYLLSIESNL